MSEMSLSTFRPAMLSSRSGSRSATPAASVIGLEEPRRSPARQRPGLSRSGARTFFTLVAPGVNAAICRGLFRQVRFLVQFGADVNERDAEGRTPLMLCALIDSEPWAIGLARVLIEKGASIGKRDQNKLNALHYAAIYSRQGLVTVFLSAVDFDLNQVDKLGNTALHYAVSVGNAVVVERLASALRRYQLPVDVANKKGMTPLMQAYKCGNTECAALLLAQDDDNTLPPDSSGAGWDGDDVQEENGSYMGDAAAANQVRESKTDKVCDEKLATLHEPLTPPNTPSDGQPPVLPHVHVRVTSQNSHSSNAQQKCNARPSSAHVTSAGLRPVSSQPSQQKNRRSAWRRQREEAVESDPELDILNQPKNIERLYYPASETELRNRPDLVFNMDPIKCVQLGTSTHPLIPCRRLSVASSCTNTKPPVCHPSSWRCEMKKLYGAFAFQFTPSFIAGVNPLPPETEHDPDDSSSLRPGSTLPSEAMTESISDIASICSKRSAGCHLSNTGCTADAKLSRQLSMSSAKKRPMEALLTLRGDSDASSTDTSVSSTSSMRRRSSFANSPEGSQSSMANSRKSGKARIGKVAGSLHLMSKLKGSTHTN